MPTTHPEAQTNEKQHASSTQIMQLTPKDGGQGGIENANTHSSPRSLSASVKDSLSASAISELATRTPGLRLLMP
jgi:hypothetical protein